MPKTETIETLVARYAGDIAFVAEEAPATTVDAFIDQLGTVAQRLSDARISGAEDLETAATYLADASRSESGERRVLLTKAADYLRYVADMVDEYRLMV